MDLDRTTSTRLATSDRGPSPRSRRGLDWVNFFVADVQTGVGPFVAIYLASIHWSSTSIGWVLTAGGVTGIASQWLGGAVVDASHHKRTLLAASILATTASALVFALHPTFGPVLAAHVLHGVVGSVCGPAIAAISLGLVGYRCLGERLGRNHRFDSAGNLGAAGLMGFIGYAVSTRAIFWVTALLAVPTILALSRIRSDEIDNDVARGGGSRVDGADAQPMRVRTMLKNRPLVTFMSCAVLFHFANAAMLPLVGAMLARGKERQASLLLSACIMTTQVIVMLAAPWVGRSAERGGRRPLLLLCFGVLPLRGALYAVTTSPALLIGVQVLDGIGAAIFGTVSALVIADVTRGSGRFNLAQGTVGVAVGIGASLSNVGAGYVVDRFGYTAAFVALSAVALVALLLLAVAMPETRQPVLSPSPRS
jgi:MFS family permease